MNISLKISRLTLVMFLTATCAIAGWKTGTPLPNLAKFKLDGAVPDLAGKVVLVDFWASWCGPCKTSFPSLEKLQKLYGERGLVVLAVNQDKTDKAMRTFLTDHPATFPIVRDTQNQLIAEADVSSMPASFLVDREGKIRHLHKGFHGEKTLAEYEQEIGVLLQEKNKGKP
ncbi:MAG: TlpA disulfide reductase family protein [bacterium]